MFGSQFIAVQSRRIGLGVAVAALALTSLTSPISAAAPEDTVYTVPMAQQQGGDQPPAPKPSVVIPVSADIQVVARGKVVKNGTTYYHFLIKNNGPANAPQIVGYKEAHTKALIGNGFNLVDNGYFNFGLNAGQTKAVTVTCTPAAGFYCAQGTTLVFMNNMADPNSSNDIATIQ